MLVKTAMVVGIPMAVAVISFRQAFEAYEAYISSKIDPIGKLASPITVI